MSRTHCAACSAEIDADAALRWARPDGRVLSFCSEECRVVGRDIEPPEEWVRTGEYRDDARAGGRRTKRRTKKRPAAGRRTAVRVPAKRGTKKAPRKPAKTSAARKPAKKTAARKTAAKPAARKPAGRRAAARR